MCGIVGLFLKDQSLAPSLGDMLGDMLVAMSDRGPDSAGVAVYSEVTQPDMHRITVYSPAENQDFAALSRGLIQNLGIQPNEMPSVQVRDTHAVLTCRASVSDAVVKALKADYPEIRIMSRGSNMEIYKEVGLPETFLERFNVRGMSGTHAIGHTRMATESAVTTLGAHPFSTGSDECLVHNGSLSNHNNLRRSLIREGVDFATDNDSEVAAAYLTHEMMGGKSLGDAMKTAVDSLDGFYTFVVGTRDGFGVLRDPISCKPAVMAETDAYVAFGSEYRALVNLPKIKEAKVWEPEPAHVYFWAH